MFLFIFLLVTVSCKQTTTPVISTTVDSTIKIHDLTYQVSSLVLKTQMEILAPYYPTYYGSLATKFTISPALPKGLSFSSISGRIAGTPEELLINETSFTITASNSTGSTSYILKLKVINQNPFGLHYTINNFDLITNLSEISFFPIANDGIRGGAKIDSYSVNPSLPEGLVFDTKTGSIEGIATTRFPVTDFTITGSNSGGSVSTILTLSAKSNLGNIVAGGKHTCATIDGIVKCWGDNTFGQLGNSTVLNMSLSPVAINTTLPFGLRKMILGSRNSCLILLDGSLYCFGHNSSNQFGPALLSSQYSDPLLVTDTIINGTLSKEGNPYSNQAFSCSTTNNGLGFCFGMINGTDFSTTSNQILDVLNNPMTGILEIVSGKNNLCVISNNALNCLGSNLYGQLGDGLVSGTQSMKSIVPIGLDSGVNQVAVGNDFTCALKNNKVYCFGKNDKGQLGAASLLKSQSNVPILVEGLPVDYIATNIYAGDSHACALISSQLYCWGDNSIGQVGNGSVATNIPPIKVQLNSSTDFVNVTSATLGDFHSCILADNNYYCFGNNDKGQLGNGNQINQSLPSLVNL